MSVPSAHSLVFVARAKAGLKNTFGTLRDTAAELHVRYGPLGVRAGLLLQSGFFLLWLQGDETAVRSAHEAALASGSFCDERELYGGLAPELLTDEWTLVWMQRDETLGQLNRRIEMLQLTRKAGLETTPIHLWRAFSTGDASRASARAERANPLLRLLVVGHTADIGLDIVNHAARAASVGVSTSRVASTATRLSDVATTFADLPSVAQPGLRVMAIARNGLKVGLFRLFVRSFSWVVIAAESTDSDVKQLFAEVHEALSVAGVQPTIIGLSPNQLTLELLSTLSQRAGYRFFALNAVATVPADAWGALAPLVADASTTEPTPTQPLKRGRDRA